MQIELAWERLKAVLDQMGCAVLAYSGGVDSSLLLKAAAETLGPNLIAVTADSPTYPPGELQQATSYARSLGIRHRIIASDELAQEAFAANSSDRCYYCKNELFAKIRRMADIEGISFILDGTNADDSRDHRPGSKAAAEQGVRSPLAELGFTKQDIRDLARSKGLPMWNKPSLACLSSRIPYGTPITRELLATVQAAEDVIRGLGVSQVRVRHHGDTARIEIAQQEFSLILADGVAERVVKAIKDLGFTYVCLDLEGYRTGSMNAVLKAPVSGMDAISSQGAKE
ncbi:MAG: ATP-dependent sacrificial sulfur transferase LarE [Nitrospirota bacterium]|nr:ATP-dependent sacrificial sulfur transferase LarE [Nitrospirota bacterium]